MYYCTASTNYGFIMYTQSQDDNITSDALSRCRTSVYFDYTFYINILEDAYGC